MDSADDDPDLRWVVENELRLLDPAVRRSRTAVAALLDPGFHEFGASGRVWDRDSVLDLLAGEDAPPTLTDDMQAARLGPDAVLLTYRSRTPDRTSLRSSVWRRRDGGPWRIWFHQGTGVDGVS